MQPTCEYAAHYRGGSPWKLCEPRLTRAAGGGSFPRWTSLRYRMPFSSVAHPQMKKLAEETTDGEILKKFAEMVPLFLSRLIYLVREGHIQERQPPRSRQPVRTRK